MSSMLILPRRGISALISVLHDPFTFVPSPEQACFVVFSLLGLKIAAFFAKKVWRLFVDPVDRFYNTKVEECVLAKFHVVGKVQEPSLADIPVMVKEMETSYHSGRSRPIEKRLEQLNALLQLFDNHSEELIAAVQADLGRPRFEASLYDVEIPRHEVVSLIKNLREWLAPETVGFNLLTFPSKNQKVLDPYGNTLVIGTWNYPIMLCLAPVAGAIAGGNTCILKPSNVSKHCADLLGRLVPRYLDPAIVSVAGCGIPGDRHTIQALLEQKFDFIFFTGGTSVGRQVMEKAAAHLCPVALELGGKNPVFVAADADLDVAAKRTIWGRMMNAGQQCISPDYVLCDRRVEKAFLAKCRHYVSTLYGEGGEQKSRATVGRIVNDRHMKRLIQVLGTHGGEVVIGGGYEEAERFIEPTVLSLDLRSPVMEDETFGPILMVCPVDSMDDGIRFVNSRPKPLTLYIFSSDDATANRIASSTTAGGVTVNGTLWHCGHPELPFGGVGASGMGAYHGKATLTTFTHSKPVLKKAVWKDGGLLSDPFFINPPWTDLKEKLLKLLVRLS